MRPLKRGDIYYADLSPVKGSEQGGYRPVLVIQNDIGNKHAPTTIVAVITSRHTKAKLPTHYWIKDEQGTSGLRCESMVELEQIRTIDKTRLKEFMGVLSEEEMKQVDKKIKVSLGLR